MLPDPLSIIWRSADVPDPELTGDEICCLAPSIFDCLVNLELLKQTTTARHVTCLDCTEQHVEEVLPIKGPDGCTRFFIRCPENGRVEVSRDRLLQYAVDYTPLQQAVALAFSAQGTSEETIPGRLWNLGRATLGGKSRVLWIARGLAWSDVHQLKDALPRGQSPVLFFIGQQPEPGLIDIPHESMIDLRTTVRIEAAKLIIDVDLVDCQLRQGNINTDGRKSPPKKRATRAALIDALKKELRAHLYSARDFAYSSRKKTGIAELLPRPTQKQLADRLNTNVSNISRAINDEREKELKYYWEGANDLSQVMKFKK